MLLRFKCEECNTVLVARAGFGDGDITCRLCGHRTPPPDEPEPDRARPSPGMPTASVPDEEDVRRRISHQAAEDAQEVAWAEARTSTASERLRGMIFTSIGAIVSALGVGGYVYADVVEFPTTSCIAAAAFGALGCFVGITIWRLSGQTTDYEYRQLLPVVTDRIRRQYWEQHRPSGGATDSSSDAWMGHAPVASSIRPMN